MESRALAGVVAFSLTLVVLVAGVAFILYSRNLAGEYRPPPGSRRWIGEGFLRLDDYTVTGRASLVKAGLCLAIVFVAMPMAAVSAEWLLPAPMQPQRRAGPTIPAGAVSLAAVAMFHMTALLAGLALMLLSAVQFLLAQRHALAPWSEAGWRRVFDASLFEAEGRALRKNAKWLLLGGVLTFGLSIALLMMLRSLPLLPK